LLLICLAVVVPLSGPRSMMAQEGVEEEGMIVCRARSDSALMELTLPEAGGAVEGFYVVRYTAHDTTPLYDEDGTLDYYDEDREVSENVEFSGTYSGGEQGSFSGLRVRGTGAVTIDNLEDDKFDRSYAVQMDSPATAVWGPGGTLSITGMTDEMTPVSINANHIPNTEWLEIDAVHFPDPTMVCGPRPRVQTLEDIACIITTDPAELGARDTTFQANITAVGFDPGAILSYNWRLRGGVSAENEVRGFDTGPNPTISWRESTFSDGYYYVQGMVTDGGHVASCFVHFTIGDVEPNNPPECIDVRIVPFPPLPGDPFLGVIVRARDADGDALEYFFDLSRGFDAQAPGTRAEDPVNYSILSIPGGLQPGPYTVEVTVSDGKTIVVCTLHFIVPPFPGERGRCDPVGIIYLDDEGVEPNMLAIDAFIENALAQGGAEYSLIISHRQRLIDKFGQEGFEQIDGSLHNMVNIAETCPFVLIVGNPDVVPFTVLPNPTDDGDVLFTDDVYGDNDHDGITMLDIPVARIPDGNSLDLLLTQLSPSSVPEGGDFTLANSKRPHAEGVAGQVFGPGRILLESLPTRHGDVDPGRVNVRYGYFMLHGSSWDTGIWWGEEDAYPEAFTVAEAESQGVVLSGSCYGAHIFNRTPENSIALAFLGRGARAFVGSTGIHYSPRWAAGTPPTGPMRFGALFQYVFLEALSQGQAPLAAFMEAKGRMADLVWSGNATASEYKIMHEFVYYGKP
jgi:hypothetical protein